jgi:hypothetical protein
LEPGSALEGRAREQDIALEGRPVELGVYQQRAAVVVPGSGGKETAQKLLGDRHAAGI